MLRFTGMADVYNAGPCTATGPGEASRGVVGGYGTEQLTVPVLFDVASRTVVSNDPAQMLLMLDFWADRLRGPGGVDVLGGRSLYPEALRDEIEMVNATVYPGVNNGVYCCWFTKDEHSPAFQEGFGLVQRALTWLNARLAEKTYLCGDHVSLADVRAFPHLYRFDCIYYQLMLREKGLRIFSGDEPLPHLARWLRDTMLGPGAEHSAAVRESCDLQVATRFYFSSLPSEEADALYDRRNAEASGIFPSREEWVAKRQKEGFIEPEQVTGHNG
ncbi:unnamed protein product [Prorocentrum cordatum]|uniref:GST C-terminal domain-containing protein n=1 Tax=Prorocentrum cordatum TaxID=2364126 RepID=A0ABN9PK98_9DINO|nr:unnamed protein product [Polarella glacialis]